MAKQKQGTSTKRASTAAKVASRSRPIAERGIKTADDMAAYLSAMITDISTGATPPEVSNAACNEAGKLLKVVEKQLRQRPLRARQTDSPLNEKIR